MPIQLSFVNASALTLLTATPLSKCSPQRRQSPSYRISTTVCMTTNRTRTKRDSDSSKLPPPANMSEADCAEDLSVDPLLAESEGDQLASWDQDSAEYPDDDDKPLNQLFFNTSDENSSKRSDDEELIFASNFEDGEGTNDGEEEGEEEEGEEEEEEEDEDEEEDDDLDAELAARVNGDDFDHDISIATLDKPSRRSASQMTLDADDDDEEVDDADDMIEPIGEGLEPIFEDVESTLDVADVTENEEPPLDEEEEIPESFDEETEEEIQNAANILSKSGLLGLGVEGGKRADMSAVKEFAMGTKSSESELEEEFDDEGLPLDLSEEDDVEDDEEGEETDVIDDYPDLEEDEDDGFTLTSESSFGRVWELNEDAYVTITEPGESYAYELDEEDEEDQEMASMRRGKQGGWSGGLASYPADNLPEGSKEWIARRSYELMTKATPVEMFRWTRRHRDPPVSICELYPEDPPAPLALGKTTLKFSSPSSEARTIGRDTSGSIHPVENKRLEESDTWQNPLERAIKFPCMYKFKVEGAGSDFPECLRGTVEQVLGKKLPDMELELEPAGRYERVVISVEVESAQQVTELYDALRSNPSVKFSFG